MGIFILLVTVFLAGVWVGMTKLGTWYALLRLGQYENDERRRRIRARS